MSFAGSKWTVPSESSVMSLLVVFLPVWVNMFAVEDSCELEVKFEFADEGTTNLIHFGASTASFWAIRECETERVGERISFTAGLVRRRKDSELVFGTLGLSCGSSVLRVLSTAPLVQKIISRCFTTR